ncbi:MAG: metallophosphoesterase family protein [Desulfobaccales bacterium]|nr:metallophosphoesterase family protein [Desulfobaccales bacterium]
MVVGVVSDTHGNREGMALLAERLKAFEIEVLLHLGDDYQDVAVLEEAGFKVLAVPGAFCPEYAQPQVPNRPVVKLKGVKMLLSHTPQRHKADLPEDPDPEAPPPDVRLVLYGHTHIPALENRQGILWVNPGHLKTRHEMGYPSTFAILRLSPRGVSVEIRRLEDGEVVMSS